AAAAPRRSPAAPPGRRAHHSIYGSSWFLLSCTLTPHLPLRPSTTSEKTSRLESWLRPRIRTSPRVRVSTEFFSSPGYGRAVLQACKGKPKQKVGPHVS